MYAHPPYTARSGPELGTNSLGPDMELFSTEFPFTNFSKGLLKCPNNDKDDNKAEIITML